MKLLLDENLPVKLKNLFSSKHQIKTVSDMGWAGKKNGELLGLMTLNGFDALVTMDKNLAHQQNIQRFELNIFILNALNNKISTLKPFIEELEKYKVQNEIGNVIEINRN